MFLKSKAALKVVDAPTIRGLIWVYFYLLMFEGALRKWVLPSFSDPLLLVRDPVLVLIYIFAFARGVFPTNIYITNLTIIGIISVMTGMTVGSQNLFVTAYGFDSMFFHLPLIFVIPKVMTRANVIRVGLWVLILSLPMAALMVAQFRSSPDALINCGVSGSIGNQIRGAMGKVRPPGFFTFITGAAQFLALTTAFIIYGFWKKRTYSWPLLIGAGVSLVVAAVVSTSRLALGGIGTVLVMVGVVVLYDRKGLTKVLGMLVPIGLILVVATNLDVFQEGREVFEVRLEEAGDKGAGVVGTATNWTARAFGDLYAGFAAIENAPLFGAGLGVGTNVGARILSGQYGFLLAEGEWARVVLELGPILAIPYLLLRVCIAFKLFNISAQSAREGNALPLLLFGGCALLMVIGQFSQVTTLGFAVLQAGLCLASANVPMQESEKHANSVDDSSVKQTAHKMPGCSSYAIKLRENGGDDLNQIVKR